MEYVYVKPTVYYDEICMHYLNTVEFDAIVIHHPMWTRHYSSYYPRSNKSLEEHIDFIKKNHIKKAIVVAEDLHFLEQCPELEYIDINPAYNIDPADFFHRSIN